ncbi:MAG TPA: type II secretion system F family protein [Selenomonadales bacterium]|nr:type II secretion system F family protein [Selenomonadales bacterium]
MATNYVYRARDRTGQLATGELLADGPAAVAAHIRNQGLFVIRIEEARAERKDLQEYFESLRGVALRDLAIFCRQFATMMAAGLPLVNSLSILIEQTPSPVLRKALQSVYKNVQEGAPLSTAMAQHPAVFPKVMIYLVESGELGGVLDEVLEQLAVQFEKDHKLNQRVKSAMVYPAAVLGFALLAVAAIVVFILPTFVSLYSQMRAELPLPTRLLLKTSDLLRGYGVFFLAALAAGAFGLSRSAGFPGFKAVLDQVILRLPVFGLLYRKVAIARFSRTLSTLVQGGVPIVQGLDVVKNTTDIKPMVAALTAAQDSIREGFSFAAPLSQSGLFPPMVVQMVAIGEETGKLDGMLRKVADFYENDVDDMVARLSSLLEPFLIVVLGGIIGSMIVAIMYPLFDMVGKMGH